MADREARKQQITARRREQILNAALDVFVENGYAGATIPQIAHRAGLASGTIYLYFSNKRELFIKVIEGLLVTPLLSIFENAPANDFPSVLKAALNNRLQLIGSGALERLILLISEILRDPELKTTFSQTLLQPLFKRMGGIFAAQQSSGLFRTIDPEITVRLVGGMMIGISLMRNVEGQSSPFSRLSQDQIAQEIMEFILHGVMKPNGTGVAPIPPE